MILRGAMPTAGSSTTDRPISNQVSAPSVRMLEHSQAIKVFYAQLSPARRSVFGAEAMFGPRWERGQHRPQS